MSAYYCNVLIAEPDGEHEELTNPDPSHVCNAFDNLRRHGRGTLKLGRLSVTGHKAAAWIAPIVQLSHDSEREVPWLLVGFGRDRECEAGFSRYDQACNVLLRAFNSAGIPELSERDGWRVRRSRADAQARK